MTPDPVIVVLGPTAVGKSAHAIDLARTIGGEVVNADSMQLYRGMDIGTAKVSAVERGEVAHHLLDIWPVTRAASVADFQGSARAAIADIHARGRIPILTGGSGLYIQATIDDLNFPGTDPVIRARPIFAPSRAMGSGTTSSDPLAGAQVSGSWSVGRQTILVLRQADGRTRNLRIGQAVNQWLLSSVTAEGARFVRDGQRIVIPFGGTAPQATTSEDPPEEEQ